MGKGNIITKMVMFFRAHSSKMNAADMGSIIFLKAE